MNKQETMFDVMQKKTIPELCAFYKAKTGIELNINDISRHVDLYRGRGKYGRLVLLRNSRSGDVYMAASELGTFNVKTYQQCKLTDDLLAGEALAQLRSSGAENARFNNSLLVDAIKDLPRKENDSLQAADKSASCIVLDDDFSRPQRTRIIPHLQGKDLSPSQVWLADGHPLVFDVVNPTTGKPERMSMTLTLDDDQKIVSAELHPITVPDGEDA